MCYDNCEYFRFNPMTGTDRCIKPRHKVCPEDACKFCDGDAEKCDCIGLRQIDTQNDLIASLIEYYQIDKRKAGQLVYDIVAGDFELLSINY